MSLLPRCMYCERHDGGLVAVAEVASGSGPGWSSYACKNCRIEQRLVPLVAQASNSWGGLHHWPEVVPHELVARLADLGDAPQLRPIADRLFPAAAVAASRAVDDRRRGIAAVTAQAAVVSLWAAVAPDGLTPVPDGGP
ncbi:hypothetical protein [Streptomyces avicenniae]|uniref:hypothetical protein n=1 Tax=Streptomyces avicenniae TaxID=500153 RepID=UPI00167C566A|nr:hypothetical protein [Streptomyces avicenniae]